MMGEGKKRENPKKVSNRKGKNTMERHIIIEAEEESRVGHDDKGRGERR